MEVMSFLEVTAGINTIKNKINGNFFRFYLRLIELTKTNNTKILRIQRFINAISKKTPYLRNALLLTMESEYTNPTRIFNKAIKNDLKNLNPFKRYKDIYSEYSKKMDDYPSVVLYRFSNNFKRYVF